MNLAKLPQYEIDAMREHQLICLKRDAHARKWLKRPRTEIAEHIEKNGDEELRNTLNIMQQARKGRNGHI